MANTNKQLSIAHIGLGRIGVGHAKALLSNEHVKLTVANRTHAKAEAFAKEHGCNAIPVEDIFAQAQDFDGVVIASSTDTHEPLIVESCKANLPFFCEKPLAGSLEGMLRAAEAIKQSGVAHHIGFNRRFDPGYRSAKADINAGKLGTITRIAMTSSDAFPPSEDFIPTSGGIYMDMGVHDYDILRWITGQEVEWVYAIGAERGEPIYAKYGDVDETQALFKLTDGTLASQQMSRNNGAGYDIRMEVFGQTSMRAIGMHSKAALISAEQDGPYPMQEPYPTFDKRFELGFIDELNDFVEMIRTGKPSACTYQDAMEATYIALAATQSYQTGERVYVADIKAKQ